MRKLILLAVVYTAARMAKRELARGTGPYAEIMAALCQVTGLLLAASTANTAKTRAVEDRLNLLVPRIPVPQTAPATGANGGQSSGGNSSYSTSNSSYSTSNSSYSMGGGTNATYNSGSGNQGGGPSSSTSGQVGGAAAHYHDMTHYHTTSSDLENVFNTLQGSYSGTIPALNALQGSFSAVVPAVNALQGSYSATISNLNSLTADHNQLVADHNNLKTALMAAGILK